MLTKKPIRIENIRQIYIFSIVISILLPFAIDWIIVNKANSFPSNISDINWIGFLGNYLGGIFGGLATLYAFVKSIEYYREKDSQDYARYKKVLDEEREKYKIEKRLSLLPCVQVFIEESDLTNHKLVILDESSEEYSNLPRYSKCLMIKNIGLGTFLNLEMTSTRLLFKNYTFNGHLGLSKDQEYRINLQYINRSNCFAEYDLRFTYLDLLNNKYKQDTVLKIDIINQTLMVNYISLPELV